MISSCKPGSAPPCPPIAQKVIATVGSGDSSSIEVGTNTYAMYDSGSGYWCKTTELAIKAVPKSTADACKIAHANCLGEVDLKPDNVKIMKPYGTPYSEPVLSYDFSTHTTPTRNPESCVKDKSCYAFYRLNSNPTPTWVWAGAAGSVSVGSKWYAQGNINHLSLYALVELPPPQPVARPRNLVMVVASDFQSDDAGGLKVALQVISDDQNELATSDEILFHFTPVYLDKAIGDIPPECQVDLPLPDRFTCLFPTGTEVSLILTNEILKNLHEINRLDNLYGQDFYAQIVEMYY